MTIGLNARRNDSYHLQRFVEAQSGILSQVQSELSAGLKTTHWMWFIFPQIKGLGSSATAREFAISGLSEARAYLQHPELGPRLRACTTLVNAINGRSVEQIFGYPDHLKFHSSMTLFHRASTDLQAADEVANRVFAEALTRYFAGKPDPATVAQLADAR